MQSKSSSFRCDNVSEHLTLNKGKPKSPGKRHCFVCVYENNSEIDFFWAPTNAFKCCIGEKIRLLYTENLIKTGF